MMEIAMTGTPLPCPFCGAELTQHNLVHGGIAWMHYDAETWCPARGVQCYSAATQAAWNRRVPPPGQAALVETLREAVADALRPFAWVADRMISGPQFVRGYPDTKPDDTDECEILSIGDGDGGNQSLLRRDFMSARAALIALQGRT